MFVAVEFFQSKRTIYNMYDLENGAEIFLQKNLG